MGTVSLGLPVTRPLLEISRYFETPQMYIGSIELQLHGKTDGHSKTVGSNKYN